jgi:hypothetical protein
MKIKLKKSFLLGTVAALFIVALCATPLLAPTAHADDGSSTNGDRGTGSQQDTGGGPGPGPGPGSCLFSVTIDPTTATAGAEDVQFSITYQHTGNTNAADKLGRFESEIPEGFSDVQIIDTTAVSYNGAAANWSSWVAGSLIVSEADTSADYIQGDSNSGKRGWVQVDFTADIADCAVGYLDLDPDGPTDVTAGEPFNITVTAKYANGNKINNYNGTVHFTSSDGEPWPATLPADYTFKNSGPGDDHGDHEFHNGATLYTSGPQTITVCDPATYNVDLEFTSAGYKWSGGCGSCGHWQSVQQCGCEPEVTVSGQLCCDTEDFNVEPGCATRLDLTPDGGNTAESGVAFNVAVTAYDAWDNIATGYAGTVHFSSSDAGALLPGDYLFDPSVDMGVHTFLGGVTLYAYGVQTVTVEGTGYTPPCDQGHRFDGSCECCPPPPPPPPCPSCDPPAPDTEDWTLEEPPPPAPEPAPEPTPEPEEEEFAGYEGATVPTPLLVVDVQGTVAYYPVTLNGALLVDAITTSPDGLLTLRIPRGCPVLNADGTPAYVNPNPDVFSISAANLAAPAGATILAAYQFEPADIIFSCDASIIIGYDPNKLPAGKTPVIAAYNGATGQWTDLETAGYVAGGVTVPNILQAHTSQTLYFAVLAK